MLIKAYSLAAGIYLANLVFYVKAKGWCQDNFSSLLEELSCAHHQFDQKYITDSNVVTN